MKTYTEQEILKMLPKYATDIFVHIVQSTHAPTPIEWLTKYISDLPDAVKNVCLKPVAVKEIGKTYYWSRNEIAGHKGEIVIISEGGSSRMKGWQVRYTKDEVKAPTRFAKDDELFELVEE